MPPFQYTPFSDRFSGTISDLMARKGDIAARGAERLGDIQAQGARQQGALVGGTIASIGQSLAAIPAQQQKAKVDALQLQGQQLQVSALQQQSDDLKALDAAYAQPGGRAAVLNALPGHLRPQVAAAFEASDKAHLESQKLRDEADKLSTESIADLGATVRDYGYDPKAAQLAISDFKLKYANDPQRLQQIKQVEARLHDDPTPETVKALVDPLIALSPKRREEAANAAELAQQGIGKGDYTINGQRFNADGTPIGAPVPPQKERVPPSLGSFEDYVGRKYGASPTPAQIEEARKTYQQADDRPRVNVNLGGPGTEGGLTPDGLALAATAYRLTRQLPSRNASQNAAIMNEAAKQASALGQSPATVIQKQAAQKSDGAALTKMTTMASAAEAFETKANAQAGLVAELSKKVGRTGLPLVNGILVSGKAALGDTDAHLFGNALLTFTSEYAKIMEGATGSAAGSSDAARKDAARLISTALKDGTIQKTIQQMQWEMRQTIMGYDTVIGHINDRLGGQTQNTGKGDPLGIR